MAENSEKSTANVKKVLIVVCGIMFMFFALCVTAYFVAVKVIAKEPHVSQNNTPKTKVFVSGGEFLTNLSDRSLIKVSIEYELENKEVKAEIEKRAAEIRDVVNSVLRSKTAGEVNGEKGMSNLRIDIRNAINKILLDGKIINVYFNDILVN